MKQRTFTLGLLLAGVVMLVIMLALEAALPGPWWLAIAVGGFIGGALGGWVQQAFDRWHGARRGG